MKAKKLVYENDGQHIILLGKVLKDDSFFIEFQTGAGKIHIVNKKLVLSLTDTDQEYKGVV